MVDSKSQSNTEPLLDAPPSYDDSRSSIPKTTPRGPFPLDIPILTLLRGERVILASASPRRKQLLAQIGLTNIEIIPSTKPENLDKIALSAFEYVLQTSHQKCIDVYEQVLTRNALGNGREPKVVISADTIVVASNGRILEKPRSEKEHVAMLTMLRNQVEHKVCTAVCVLSPREDARTPGYNMQTTVEETTVVFDKEVSDELILAYVKTREAVGMAGGYGIQGMGTLLVEKIEGSYDNVVGLPVRVTLGLIEKAVMDQDQAEEEGEGAYFGLSDT